MRQSLLKDNDLHNILTLLEIFSFSQVAILYGYDTSAIRNGGTGIRNFLHRHGVNPKKYTKHQGRIVYQHNIQQNESTLQERPKLVDVYFDETYRVYIKRYEARYAII